MIKKTLYLFFGLFLLIIIYSLGLARGHKKGMFHQWIMTEALNYSIWHGTGEDDDSPGFPGLARYLDNKGFDEVLHPDGVQLKGRE